MMDCGDGKKSNTYVPSGSDWLTMGVAVQQQLITLFNDNK